MHLIAASLQGQLFDFCYYLVIVRSHVVSGTRPEAGKRRRKKGKSDSATAVPRLEESPVFDCFESELLQKVRSVGLSF